MDNYKNQIIQFSKNIFENLDKGYCENIYHNAFKVELQNNDIKFQSELNIPVKYKNFSIGIVRADLVIEKKIVIELKAMSSSLSEKDVYQLKKYLKLLNIPIGFLINFSQSSKKNLEMIYIVNNNVEFLNL